ncbi:hypothetical protein NPIL_546021 [Nephila pilipes]|uniref:Uncharacterized protein n=1 Tax=Nephila pilipes TaxID=299642 RepID=A0A8X6N771_NEPPI|nr:hypothetical protein NPIL_546021 [Nephila pilipes]
MSRIGPLKLHPPSKWMKWTRHRRVDHARWTLGEEILLNRIRCLDSWRSRTTVGTRRNSEKGFKEEQKFHFNVAWQWEE